MDMNKIYNDGIFGVVTGDALGLPVQFADRSERDADPVRSMRGYGVFNMPAGSWSDDSSLTLAALDAINTYGMNYDAIMHSFMDWLYRGKYTPSGRAYDIGGSCMRAIDNYKVSGNWRTCGTRGENDNGNGSLMRIMPFVLYGYEQSLHGVATGKIIEMIHNGSSLTHAHIRSKLACGIYYFLAKAILDYKADPAAKLTNEDLRDCLQKGMDAAVDFYSGDTNARRELNNYYSRLFNIEVFAALPRNSIRSSGYVVDSLEAAVWCLATTKNYKACALKAVNLGLDTDTVGAIAGGLAGLFYGKKNIPQEWIDVLARKRFIETLVSR